MAAKKTPRKKAPSRKKALTAAAQARAEHAQFMRQQDLSVLQRADEVRGDPNRMAGVRREARDQQAAIRKVTKK